MPAALLGAEVMERSKTLAGEEREFRQLNCSVVCAKATEHAAAPGGWMT